MDTDAAPAQRFEGVHCTLLIEQPLARLFVLRIAGSDVGEFGGAPMAALEALLPADGTVEIYIDARRARGATIDVSSDWGRWLGRHKARLQRVTMLTGSRFVEVTAEFVRRFAELDGVMRLCTDPDVFDRALADAAHWR